MAICLKGKIIESDEKLGRDILGAGFGRRSEGGVELHPLEAAFLAERNIVQVEEGKKPLTPPQIFAKLETGAAKKKTGKKTAGHKAGAKGATGRGAAKMPPAEALMPENIYLIYRALRLGGNVVRFSSGSPLMWRVYAKGVGREHERPQSILRLVDKDWQASLETLERELAVARLLRLELVLGYVKEGKPCLIKVSKPPIEV